MQTPFGKTGLHVTRIGLGLAALGRPGYINLGHADDLGGEYDFDAMRDHAHRVLDTAWDGGVRYFDAARSYGQGEAFLGTWLQARDITPDQVTIGSKWGYTYTANWQVEAEDHEIKEHSLRVLNRQWSETQANLGEHLNLYQIHSATFSSGVLENTEVLEELARLKDESDTRIGLSLSGPDQAAVLEAALAVKVDGVPLFDAVQATWNILEPSAGGMLHAAHDAGWGVIIKEALANGRLTPRNDHTSFATQRAQLDAMANDLNTTLDALALAAVLAQPFAQVVLSGAATVEHMQSNLAALNVNLNDDQLAQLSTLAEAPDDYWQTRANLAWN